MSVIFFQNKYFPKVKFGHDFQGESDFCHKAGVALNIDGIFLASGLNEGGNIYSTIESNVSSDTLKDWIAKSFGDINVTESEYIPGTFYKRIWRPLVCVGSFHKAISQKKLNESFVSLRILLNKLEELFKTVEPTTANLKVYGYRIREIILLACMEVESSWSAVLKENEYSSGNRFTTNDYVKLANPMFLDGYEMSFQSYHNFPPFTPFENWDKGNPTESLSWYDAYNKTKHDREENLKFATLENAVKSVGAAVVMFHAQFGFNFGSGFMDEKNPVIRNIFRIITLGLKKYEKEYYVPKFNLNDEMHPIPSWDWIGINYPF